ncbi:IQ calmodulin-binding motif family protein [Trichomonas vaginalis G3]|uniref:IQ calmodulin-binding motif family protein n=1 Tax=Trichomonas vaginalis (strain ATCC PRA-98 / G3) TaxID=412133 RepID=A2DDE4_TRIV3|nr:NADH dehydrogenase (ubiquinone) 1 beta subcomplex 4 family [Trichomonas vaginalis G3]EAY21623.1 IQ calmodulin-binding motif family protein [Trichomonas vaginalis G3]KAI5489701.1 NADH dehydrogenase (ubiquinone) 1 beta subcomplex 4 family [Trichomonas vaginalis G3]|eukprot:XP_001582609.1 IQ calmodulin-binding motif family protein [Trichomonas vaginalis G3]
MEEEKRELTEDEAAKMIQRAWRRHADMSLFRGLKKLVQFRNQGDPAALLRVINPIEAQLLDPAIGAHVRFRLGGFEWPPQIYYKIYLHSPVCDVNSYAPRNYADKKNSDIPPVTQEQLSEYAEKFGWYHRVENNGWRPISSLSPTAIDAITQMTNKSSPHKKPIFKSKPKHQLKLEVAKLKVQRFLQEKSQQEGEAYDPSMAQAYLDDDKLFEWADNLDMSKYKDDWDTIGTTGPSSNLWWNNESLSEDEDVSSSSDSEIDEEELLKLLQ